jgi:hypothetical protein
VTVQQDRLQFGSPGLPALSDVTSFPGGGVCAYTGGSTVLATPSVVPQINQSYSLQSVGIRGGLTISAQAIFGKLGKIRGGILLPSDIAAAGGSNSFSASNTTAGAGANAGGSGTVAWSAQASPPYEVTPGPNQASQLLLFTGCGFNIPANATIVGVIVSPIVSSDGSPMLNNQAFLFNAGAAIGVNRAVNTPWAPNDTAITAFTHLTPLGAAGDTWGANLTPAIVNSPSFGVALSVANAGNAGLQTPPITVYYTVPASLIPLPNPNLTFDVWDPASDALPPYASGVTVPTIAQMLQISGVLQLSIPLDLDDGVPIVMGLWMLPSLRGSAVRTGNVGHAMLLHL